MLTQWDYGDPKKYTHDANSTDRRNPSVNANGPIYIDPEVSTDDLYVVDPVKHVRVHRGGSVSRCGYDRARVQDDAEALAVLGQRTHLDGQDHAAQLDDGRSGTGLDRVENP